MTLKEFTNYTNFPYNSLNKYQQILVDVIDYASKNNLCIIEYQGRNGYRTNIIEIYKQYINDYKHNI